MNEPKMAEPEFINRFRVAFARKMKAQFPGKVVNYHDSRNLARVNILAAQTLKEMGVKKRGVAIVLKKMGSKTVLGIEIKEYKGRIR